MLKKGRRRAIALIVLGFFVAGCSKEKDTYDEQPVEKLYNKALVLLQDKSYSKAADAFDEVERQHPYSNWAIQSQLMSAYAYYQAQKYERAIAAVESFIQLHPAHPDIAYAYYMQGLCYFEQISSAERDQTVSELAIDSFSELVRRFPNSIYGKDARLRIDLLRDNLAAREMTIGRYYQRRGAYTAAMNRFRAVVTTYQTTSHTPEALHRLVEVNKALGLTDEAQETAAVLAHNYPNNPWYAETYLLLKGQDFRGDDRRQNPSWIKGMWEKARALSFNGGDRPKQAEPTPTAPPPPGAVAK